MSILEKILQYGPALNDLLEKGNQLLEQAENMPKMESPAPPTVTVKVLTFEIIKEAVITHGPDTFNLVALVRNDTEKEVATVPTENTPSPLLFSLVFMDEKQRIIAKKGLVSIVAETLDPFVEQAMQDKNVLILK
ncbi:hypothetical protein [Algivirga pacifica]|uniref:SCP2 domain-containing protein n=1 Tax=Algivirga pacifica TaxID=1162670 RepID=A0ABP9D622_9BACT